MNEQQTNKPIKKPTLAKFTIKWKDPDMISLCRPMVKWGEFGEYFEAEVVVDHKTGKGTIKFFKP